MFGNPLWQQLHTKIVRYIAPYDAAVRRYSLRPGDHLDPCRRSPARAGAGRLLPLRVHAHEDAQRGRLPARRAEIREAVPQRQAVPVLGRGQPRQLPRRVLEPLGERGGPLLPGADPRVQGLHGHRARRARRGEHRSDAAATSRNSSTRSATWRRSCRRSGGCTTTRTSTAWKAGARANSCARSAARCGSPRPAGSCKFGGAFPNKHGSGLTRAAKVLKFMFGLAGSLPQIKRLYIYDWTGGTARRASTLG